MANRDKVTSNGGGGGGHGGGAGGQGGVGPSRRTWDTEEYASKARSRESRGNRQQEREEELAALNAERRSQGLPPLKRLRSNLPEPTMAMQERSAPLELEKNQGKTLMVDYSNDGKGQQGPGFYCATCRKLLKDNLAYLDHINGRVHLARIGQSTHQDRATLEQVRAKLDELRAKASAQTNQSASLSYDFEARIKAIAQEQELERQKRKQAKREQRNRKKQQSRTIEHKQEQDEEQQDLMAAMGFGGFGSTKTR
ncbi:hypothetical protein BCV70DRAFT_198396 [Testicularia cyperi]|uniref:C2H2-type domain-containing protein n=1 Tax=Testicularia cyperi TaxID=1882483 RepID=A0A317XUT2_9BASI|nr:hypothetical protein BCV70DRAFT_198396 [Testicularia cyperi]